MKIQLDIAELSNLALDRNIQVKELVYDYLDELFEIEPSILWDIKEELSESAMRCITCGYWVKPEKIYADECEDCREV